MQAHIITLEQASMRYFFVSYFGITGDNNTGFGSIYYSSPNFLSAKEISAVIRKERNKPDMDSVILNIQEMNERDYKAFIEK